MIYKFILIKVENIWKVLIRSGLIYLFILNFACGKSQNLNSEDKESYFLAKIDSIRVDRENPVRILDYNLDKSQFLAYDQVTDEFLLLNSKGHLLKSVFRIGEGPNEYNSSLIAASFNYEEGGYFALSSTEFLWYNEDWEVRDRKKFASERTIKFYGGPKTKVPYYRLSENGSPFFFTSFFSGVNTNIGSNVPDVFSKYLIELYNPEIQGLDWVFKNDPQLLPSYELDEGSMQNHPVQVFCIVHESKFLYLTFEKSNEIGIYDLESDLKLIEKVQIQHQNFIASQKSKNKAVINFNSNLIGLLYFEGLSESATNLRKTEDPDYFSFQDPNVYKIIILKDGIQLQEIQFPLSCEPHSEIIVIGENLLLLKNSYLEDSEPEYTTYSVFELKKED